MDATTYVIGIAWAAILVMLAAGGLRELSRSYFSRPKLPFFAMLERRGLTYAQLEESAGVEAIALAMRHCADCGSRFDCGWRRVDCPNAPLFSRVARRSPATG